MSIVVVVVSCQSATPTMYLRKNINEYIKEFGAAKSVAILPAKSSFYLYRNEVVIADSNNTITNVFQWQQ